ncbi:MAG: hypothetical protein ACRDSZ_21320 [Pseudonocardiaceae bacterium]
MADGVIFRLVTPGETAGVVAAHGEAVTLAQQVRAILIVAGVDSGSVLVVPSLTEACEPVVYLTTLTDCARLRLAQILRGGDGPSPGAQPRMIGSSPDAPAAFTVWLGGCGHGDGPGGVVAGGV